MNENLSQEELAKLVRALAWNDAFGCYTRPGMEKLIWPEIAGRARWIIYFDVDDMHAVNKAHHGFDFADAIIKDVLTIVRVTDYAAGQWKSGDEFLITLVDSEVRGTLDPWGMVVRLSDEFKKRGMSATFAVVPVTSPNLAENVKSAVDKVYAAKEQKGIGRPGAGARAVSTT